MPRFIPAAFVLFLLSLAPANAGEANVLSATIKQTAPGVYTISAEVQHGDEGWDHYADGWQVIGPQGEVIATRELAHPHDKAPFTRSKSGIRIPAGVTEVTIRARDSVHGLGGETITLAVPRSAPHGS